MATLLGVPPRHIMLSNLNVIGMASSGPYFVAATIGGGVFRTINAASWTQATGIAGGDLNGENVWRMGGSLFYSAQGGAEYMSSDYGQTWTAWTQPAFFGLGMVEVKRFGNSLYMETRHFAGGLRDSLYRSTNEGASWTNITGNLNAADINGSGVLEHDGYVFIGYNIGSPGLGIYRYSISTDVDDVLTRSTPVVFPNPAEEVINITLPHAEGTTNYTLLDAAGRSVMSGRLIPGSSQLDLAALAPGCYFLRCEVPALAPVRVVRR